MTSFVLVHGGWHGGWCWREVAAHLRSAGHQVYAPTLTGLGDRAHLAKPGVGLAAHIRDVQAVLKYEDLHDAVLVGHDSSGAVITGVAYGDGDRLARLIYLDAVVPRPGESVLDLVPADVRERLLELARERGHGWRIPLDWEAALARWGVTDPDAVDWMWSRLVPQPLATLADPLLVTGSVPELPATFVHCTAGATTPTFAPFADRAARRPERWRLRRLDTGHSAMITEPERVARLLSEPDA